MNETTFLRRTLISDAAVSGTTGLLMLFAAAPLSQLLHIPGDLLRIAGASLLPFCAFLVWIITRPSMPRVPVLTVIALNAAWILGSIALLFAEAIDPNRVGVAFITVQAIAVAVFTEMQYAGLRAQRMSTR